MEKEAEKELDNIKNEKECPKGGPTVQRLESGGRSLRSRLQHFGRLPRGVVADTVDELNRARSVANADAQLNEEQTVPEITTDNLQSRLRRPGGNVQYWREALNEHIDSIWGRTVDKSSDGDDQVDYDSPNTETLDSEDDKDEGLRIFSNTLAGILRPEMNQYFPRILQLAEEAQASIAIIMEELSVLALKSVHLVSSRG